jgi:hypothetical protein
MMEVKEHIGDFDPNLIHIGDPTEESLKDPLPVDAPSGYLEVPNREVIPGPDLLVNAEIILPHGDWMEIAKVLGCKKDLQRLYIDRKHAIPSLDSRTFTVVFPDGEGKDISYNILAEHLFLQGDSEGRQYRLFKEMGS